MQVTVNGGKMLLVLGGDAVARVKNEHDSQATLIAGNDSRMYVGKTKEWVGACFTNGAAIEEDHQWLVDALRFLGYVVYRKKRVGCSPK